MRRVVVVMATVFSVGCSDAFTSRVDVVARVGPYELGVDRLAEIIATGSALPLQRPVAEGIAQMWVDYTIFADRMVAGDSLLDSGYVAAGMWAEIQQQIADQYHEQLVNGLVSLDSSAIDSAYAGNTYRAIEQYLFDIPANAKLPVRLAKRKSAEDTRAMLVSGKLKWSRLVSADSGSEGDAPLTLIGRGEQSPAVENAAFSLAPGEFSPVVETPEGYRIVWRPPLAEIRDQFRTEVKNRLESAFDTAFLAALPSRWDVTVRQGIGPSVRHLGQDPLRAKQSGEILGTYRGGRFRVSDLARWLQAMPINVRQQLTGASDSQAVQLVSSLMRNEVLLREARDSGITTTPEFRAEMADQLRRRIALVSGLLGFPVDTLPSLRGLPPAERQKLVQSRVLAYLDAIAHDKKRLQTVPPFLADTLRAEADWRLVPAGVERVLDRARQLRVALDSQPHPLPSSAGATPMAPPAAKVPVTPPKGDTSVSH
jgi:hypothetical protein